MTLLTLPNDFVCKIFRTTRAKKVLQSTFTQAQPLHDQCNQRQDQLLRIISNKFFERRKK